MSFLIQDIAMNGTQRKTAIALGRCLHPQQGNDMIRVVIPAQHTRRCNNLKPAIFFTNMTSKQIEIGHDTVLPL